MDNLVSIVIPAYNSKQYIGETLASCFNQTYPHLEIIVVDDGSTDGTSEWVQQHYGESVRLIQQVNSGPAAARNRGIEAAQGEYIKFLDADDIMLPQHIEKCMDVFRQSPPEMAVVYTRYQHVASDGITPLPELRDPPLLSGNIFCPLLKSNGKSILTSASVVRREACLAVGCFDERENFFAAEDWDFYLRLAAQYEYRSIDEILLRYRRHEKGLTNSSYHAAVGRLIAVQKARHYAPRRDCIPDAAYNRIEAGRHHVVAMVCWQAGEREKAREHLKQAAALTTEGAALRRILCWLSYLFPAQAAHRLIHLLNLVKQTP